MLVLGNLSTENFWFSRNLPIGRDGNFMLATNGVCHVQQAYPIGCQHKGFIPAEAAALPREQALLLGTQSTDYPVVHSSVK